MKPNQSFSIIFRGARTLDLMMKRGDRDLILDALDDVLEAYERAKVRVAKDVLLLRYIWLDVDKVSRYSCCREERMLLLRVRNVVVEHD